MYDSFIKNIRKKVRNNLIFILIYVFLMNKSLIRKNNNHRIIPMSRRGKIIEKFSIGSFTDAAKEIFEGWVNKAKDAFNKIIEAAQEEAEIRAMDLEDEGHEVEMDDMGLDIDHNVNIEDL